MTRFVMSVKEAVKLIFNAYSISAGGEVFILKMHAVPVWDLIDVYVQGLCQKHNIEQGTIKRQSIPPRPGEKQHEKLFSDYEARHTYEDETILMVLPSKDMLNGSLETRSYQGFAKVTDLKEYDSTTAHRYTRQEIIELLDKEELIY